MTDDERDGVANLIYLCTDHHTVINKVKEDWPVEKLVALKETHERQVRQAIEAAFAEIEFPELERAVSGISAQQPVHSESFELIPPDEKIKKNDLSNGARYIIAAGMMARPTVAAYVTSETQLDADFPERLRAGFLSEYFKHRAKGYVGDALFEMMCAFSQITSGGVGRPLSALIPTATRSPEPGRSRTSSSKNQIRATNASAPWPSRRRAF